MHAADAVVVDLFVIGRTLRGSAGQAFSERVLQLYDDLRGPGSVPFTALRRTVELTVVAVTRAAPVSLEVSIADPVFGGVPHPDRHGGRADAGIRIDLDDLEGVAPLVGPPHLDLSRAAVLSVESPGAVVVVPHVLES